MILFTGFEPFDNAKTNPSFEAVRLLPSEIKGARVEKLELPVVFGEAAEMIINRIGCETPEAVIMTGVAAGRDKITPEVTAVNLARHVRSGKWSVPWKLRAWLQVFPTPRAPMSATIPSTGSAAMYARADSIFPAASSTSRTRKERIKEPK